MNDYHPQGKYFHIVKDGRAIVLMIARKSNATKTARTIPGAGIVEAAGRAELRQMGIVVDGPTWTPAVPGVYEVKGAGR